MDDAAIKSSKYYSVWQNSYCGFICTLLILYQAHNQLGTSGGGRVFREGPKIFELCPIFLHYIQHIFPEVGEKFSRGALPPWLRVCSVLPYVVLSLPNRMVLFLSVTSSRRKMDVEDCMYMTP